MEESAYWSEAILYEMSILENDGAPSPRLTYALGEMVNIYA